MPFFRAKNQRENLLIGLVLAAVAIGTVIMLLRPGRQAEAQDATASAVPTISNPTGTPWITSTPMTVSGTFTAASTVQRLRQACYQITTATTNPIDTAPGINCGSNSWVALGAQLPATTARTFTGTAAVSESNTSNVANTQYVHVLINDVTYSVTAPTGTASRPRQAFKVDLTNPSCGTWSAASAWKTAASAHTCTLTGSADNQSGMAATSYSCNTGTGHNATCSVTIYDVAGRSTSCASTTSNCFNRVDLTDPSCGTWSPSANTWSKTSTTFTMGTGTAGGSAISSYTPSTRACTTAATNAATCTVTITAESGRTATCTSPQNLLDATGPSVSFSSPTGGTTWYKALQAPTVTATDTGVGMSGGSTTVRYAWATTTTDPANITASTCSGGTLLNSTGAATVVSTSGETVNSTNYLHVCAMDNLGNITKTYAQYNVDTTAPTCSGWLSESSGYTSATSTWRPSGAETWRITCSDTGGSNLSTTPVTGSFVSGSTFSCVTGTANGATCTVQVRDGAANDSTSYTSPANNVDASTPNPTASPGPNSPSWSSSNIGVTVSATSTSGISTLRYSWSNNLGASCTGGTAGTSPFNIGNAPGNASSTLYACAVNNAGTVGTNTFASYNVDLTDPSCGVTWALNAGANTCTPTTSTTAAYYCKATSPTVTLTLTGSSDAGGSGLTNSTGYNTAAITPAASPTNPSVNVTDNAGRSTSCPLSTLVYLDSTAPSCSVSVGSANPTYTNAQQTISYSTSESASGWGSWQLQQRSATISSGTVGSYGAWSNVVTGSANANTTQTTAMSTGNCYQYQLTTADALSNSTTCSATNTVCFDNANPTASISVGSANPTNTNSQQTITYSANDVDTGVSSWVVEYRRAALTNGAVGSYDSWTNFSSGSTAVTNATTSTSLTSGYCYQLRITVTDKAGNDFTATAANTICYDTTAPVCGNWSPNTDQWAGTNTQFTFTLAGSTDAHSGIADAGGSVNVNNATTCPKASYTISDQVGNTTLCTAPGGSCLDQTGPSASVSVGGTGTIYTNTQQPITYSSNDSGSGVGSWQLQVRSAAITNGAVGGYGSWVDIVGVDGSTATTDAIYTTTMTSGNCYQYQIVSVDQVGNTSTATANGTICYDTTAPVCGTVVWDPSSGPWHGDNSGTTFAISSGPSDANVGLATDWNADSNNECLTASTNGATCYVSVADLAGNTVNCGPSPTNNVSNNAPTISLTGGDPSTWYSVNRNSVVTVETTLAPLVTIRYAFVTGSSPVSPLDLDCSSGGTVLGMSGDSGIAPGATGATPNATVSTSSNGTTLFVCAVDAAGNASFNQAIFKVDTTPPTCNGTWSPSANTWDQSGVTFVYSGASNSISGLLATGGSCTSNTHDTGCTVTLTNGAGLTTNCTSPKTLIDTTVPAVVLGTPSNSPNWTNQNLSTTITATDTRDGTDAGSGIKEIRYTWNNSPALNVANCTGGSLISSGASTPNAPYGGAQLTVCAIDNVGNIVDFTNTYNVDVESPTIEILNGDINNWYNAPRSAPINRGDTGGSGIAHVRYSIGTNNLGSDCSGGTLLDSEAPGIQITQNEGTTLYACVKDVAGNVVTTNAVFLIDETPPVCPSLATGWTPYPAPWQKDNSNTTAFSMSGATDAGGSTINVSSGSCTTGTLNNSTCTVQISDRANNLVNCTSPANRIDGNAPTAPAINATGSETGSGTGSGANYTNNNSVTISLSGSEDLPSGVSGTDNAGLLLPYPYTYTFTGNSITGGEVTYTTPVPISAEGITNVTAYAYDSVSNQSTPTTTTVKLDRTLPTMNLVMTDDEDYIGDISDPIYQISPLFTFTASDPINSSNGTAASGIDSMIVIWLTEFEENEDFVLACEAALDPSTNDLDLISGTVTTTEFPKTGINVLCARSIDKAGNLSAVHASKYTFNPSKVSVLVEVDTPAPEVSGTWYLGLPSYTITATDANASGLKQLYYLLIPTSEVENNPGKYDLELYDLTTDSDARIVTLAPEVSETGADGVMIRHITAPPISEGNYTLFVAATDNSRIGPSPTTRITVQVDIQAPVVEFSYQGAIESPHSGDPNYTALTDAGFTGIINVPVVTLNTTNFDPLSTDLTQDPADLLMTSGPSVCTLQYRSVPIHTDGTGLLQTDIIGDITWSEWTTDVNYSATNCADTYNFVAGDNLAYQIRFQVTDGAGYESDPFTSTVMIYNLLSIYQPDFNDMDDNGPSNQIHNNIIKMRCTTDDCDDIHPLYGTLFQDTAANTYEVCLIIPTTENNTLTKCQQVTSSTTGPTHYSFNISPDEFPNSKDVYLGGQLTTTLLTGNSETTHTSTTDFNVIFFIQRDNPPIVAPIRLNSYVWMRNGEFN